MAGENACLLSVTAVGIAKASREIARCFSLLGEVGYFEWLAWSLSQLSGGTS